MNNESLLWTLTIMTEIGLLIAALTFLITGIIEKVKTKKLKKEFKERLGEHDRQIIEMYENTKYTFRKGKKWAY